MSTQGSLCWRGKARHFNCIHSLLPQSLVRLLKLVSHQKVKWMHTLWFDIFPSFGAVAKDHDLMQAVGFLTPCEIMYLLLIHYISLSPFNRIWQLFSGHDRCCFSWLRSGSSCAWCYQTWWLQHLFRFGGWLWYNQHLPHSCRQRCRVLLCTLTLTESYAHIFSLHC